MQFLVLYDNSSLSPAIRCGWGFACLIGLVFPVLAMILFLSEKIFGYSEVA